MHCQCGVPALSWAAQGKTSMQNRSLHALTPPDSVPCHLLTSLSRSTSFMSPKKACKTHAWLSATTACLVSPTCVLNKRMQPERSQLLGWKATADKRGHARTVAHDGISKSKQLTVVLCSD